MKSPSTVLFKTISVRYSLGVGIDEDGHLWTWGQNSLPAKVKEGTIFKNISTGTSNAYAVDTEGILWNINNWTTIF